MFSLKEWLDYRCSHGAQLPRFMIMMGRSDLHDVIGLAGLMCLDSDHGLRKLGGELRKLCGDLVQGVLSL